MPLFRSHDNHSDLIIVHLRFPGGYKLCHGTLLNFPVIPMAILTNHQHGVSLLDKLERAGDGGGGGGGGGGGLSNHWCDSFENKKNNNKKKKQKKKNGFLGPIKLAVMWNLILHFINITTTLKHNGYFIRFYFNKQPLKFKKIDKMKFISLKISQKILSL